MPVDRVTVGSAEIISVSDGEMRLHASFMFAGIPPALYQLALGPDLAADGTFAVTFGSFLVRSNGKTVLVDTGAGSKGAMPGGGHLLENLRALGVAPEDIDVVAHTHLHVDHVGWNCSERDGGHVPTFPNAQYWIARSEWDYWTDPQIVAEEGAHLRTDVLPLKDSRQLMLFDGAAAITSELSFLPTPGHTPGHCSIAVSSGGEQAIILGDVAHHPQHLVRIWIAAVDELPRISRRTKRALAERLIEQRTLVAAGHFSPGSFGRLVREDGQRAWQPL